MRLDIYVNVSQIRSLIVTLIDEARKFTKREKGLFQSTTKVRGGICNIPFVFNLYDFICIYFFSTK